MKIKRFVASSMREAIRLVREEQGPDAVILSNRRVADGVEVVAATDYDAALAQQAVRQPSVPPAPPAPPAAPARTMAAAPEAAIETVTAPALVKARTRAAAPPVAAAPQPPAAAAPAAAAPVADADALKQLLSREMDSMRRLIEQQLAGLHWQQFKQARPLDVSVLRALTHLGIEPALAREVLAEMPGDASHERARFLPLGLLARRIPLLAEPMMEKGGIFALLGPTGVGKTTTIAKLAARLSRQSGINDVALITTDHYRVGAQEQLSHYGRLLGVPVLSAGETSQLQEALHKLRDYRLVLIDTAGMAPRDRKLAEQLAGMAKVPQPIRSVLVLSAASQASDMEDAVQHFAPAHPQALILTKLDEATRIGGALSVAIRHRLPFAYTCDGQRVPEDLAIASADKLVLQAMQRARQTPAPLDEDLLALQFTGSLPAETATGVHHVHA